MGRKSMWRPLGAGLILGLLIAITNGLIFPVILELSTGLTDLLLGNQWDGPIIAFLPEVWIIYFGLGFMNFTIPSIGTAIILSLIFWLSRHRGDSLTNAFARWIGTIAGLAVAAVGSFRYLTQEGIVYWPVALLTTIWLVYIYNWMAHRMVRLMKQSE